MTTVLIAAHNESAVIERCLASLAGAGPDVEVIVVANGCSDDTAQVARESGVRVIEVAEAGKAGALNVGDAAAVGFPRVYLDADIVLPDGGLDQLVAAFHKPEPPMAVVPARRLDVTGRPLAVRAYFAINTRLPLYRRSLFGRGLIALSASGRERFQEFPAMVADDLFLDGLFSDDEKATVESVSVVVETPRRTSDLIRRLVRVRRGNADMRQAAASGHVVADVRPARRLAWVTEVMLPHPWLLPAGVIYATITTYAALQARLTLGRGEWGQDRSTRGEMAGSGRQGSDE